MKKRAWSSILLGSVLVGMSILAGCGSDKGGAISEKAPNGDKEAKGPADSAAVPSISSDPVKLTIYFGTGKPNEQEFETIYLSPLKMKYPNLTLQMVDGKLEDMVAAGETPDLIYTHVGNMFAMKDLGLLMDLNPLIKKYKVDTARFDPVILQGIEQASPGKLTALPYMLNLKALYYNKDLFDKFGVPYPKDGMNWEDAITLGKRMTRSEGGSNYRGFMAYAVTSLQRSLGNSFYDAKTMKGTLDSPDWKSFFDIWMGIYTIPGNELTRPISTAGTTQFLKDRNLAMLAQNNLFSDLETAAKDGFNWDVAQYPSLPAKPNTMTDVDSTLLLIPATSKNKDAAMQVLISVTSDDVQMTTAKRYAKMSVLRDPKFKAAFGADLQSSKGKHIEGIFKSGITISPYRDKISNQAVSLIDKAFETVYFDGSDINTALRGANEQLNKFMAEEAKK